MIELSVVALVIGIIAGGIAGLILHNNELDNESDNEPDNEPDNVFIEKSINPNEFKLWIDIPVWRLEQIPGVVKILNWKKEGWGLTCRTDPRIGRDRVIREILALAASLKEGSNEN